MIETPLLDALKNYDALRRRRFHVPAHAGKNLSNDSFYREPHRYDLTELDGLDVLSEPSGAIAEAQSLAAEAYGVGHSFFLVNGASVGLQAALLSALKPGETMLVPRNAHRSVLAGLILCGAKPAWFLPERLQDQGLWGAVTLSQVEAAFAENPEAKALVITSPTYEGIGSDIETIAAWCKRKHIALIVDEAHGSLWNFSDRLPQSACESNADVVIHSLHKSGGSLTQSALAHLPKNSCIDAEVFQQALNTLQTTSPSYLLMASLDDARAFLQSSRGKARIENLLDCVRTLRDELQGELKILRLYTGNAQWDPCKFYFRNPLEANEDWGYGLEENHRLSFESISSEGVLYLANLGLEAEDFDYFRELILAEDRRLQGLQDKSGNADDAKPESFDPAPLMPEIAMMPRDAFFAPGERIESANASGRIAKETVVHCPPGIPVLMPGERIRPHHLTLLEETVMVVR